MLKVELLKNIVPNMEQSRKNNAIGKSSEENNFKGLLLEIKDTKREHGQDVDKKEKAEDKKGHTQLRQKTGKIQSEGVVKDKRDKIINKEKGLSKSNRDEKKSKKLVKKGEAQAGFILLATSVGGKKDSRVGEESAEKGCAKCKSGSKIENNVDDKNGEVKSVEENLKATLLKLKNVKSVGHPKDSKPINDDKVVVKHKASENHFSKKGVSQEKSGVLVKDGVKIERVPHSEQNEKPVSESKNINVEKRVGDFSGFVKKENRENKKVSLIKVIRKKIEVAHAKRESKELDLKTENFRKDKKFNVKSTTDKESRMAQKSENYAKSQKPTEVLPKMAESKNKKTIKKFRVIKVDDAEANKNVKTEVRDEKTNYSRNLSATKKGRDVGFPRLDSKNFTGQGENSKLSQPQNSDILNENKKSPDLTDSVHKSIKKDPRVIKTQHTLIKDREIKESRNEITKKGLDTFVSGSDKNNQTPSNRNAGQPFGNENEKLFTTEFSKEVSGSHVDKKRKSRDGKELSQVSITARQDIKASTVSQTNNLSPPLDRVIEHIDRILSLKPPLTKTIVVKMEPPYIGVVHLKISVDSEKNLSATLAVHDKDTYKTIINHLNSLKDYLQSNGFKVQNIDVHNSFNENFFNQFSSGSGGFQQHSHTSQNSGQPAFGFFGGEVELDSNRKAQRTKVIDGIDVIV